MDPMLRSIHCVLETNLIVPIVNEGKGLKPFQLVKYVTGQKNNKGYEYTVTNTDSWYGLDTVAIQGKKGFIRLVLEPLFEEV